MFRIFWLSIKDLFDELFVLIGINLLWVLINLPLAALVGVLLVGGAFVPASIALLLLVLTLGPANAGLYTVAERITEGRTAGFGVFFEGLRQNFKLGWKIYGVWMGGLLVILINLYFYAHLNSPIGALLQLLFLYLLLLWNTLLIYIGPLMILQADKRIRTLARNAFLMTLGRPVFTAGTAIMMVLILGVSVVFPVLCLVVTFAFLATWSFRATKKLIKDAADRRAELEERAAATTGNAPQSTDKGRGGQVRPRE